jgi:hypothetical protein
MAHTSRCSNARTARCNCSCNGEFHGGSTSLARIASISKVVNPAGSSGLRSTDARSWEKRHAVMIRAKTELESWLATAAASPPDSASAVTEQTVGMISDEVARAIVDALNRSGYHWTDADHVVCAFLAAAAHAMQKVQDQLEQAVALIVADILAARPGGRRPEISALLAKVAAQAAVNALLKLSAVRQFDDLLRATRILAIMTCPAPEQHRAVVLYCLNPLETDILSDAIRQELMASLPRKWMTRRVGSTG